MDNKTEQALFSADGKVFKKSGGELNDMLIIVRELRGAPPGCPCAKCAKLPPRPVPRVTLNHWADFRAGDPWPSEEKVRALNKSLDTLPGHNPDQYVALWYQQGEPVMGRIWNEGGKIAANFGWGGNEYKQNIGSIQVGFLSFFFFLIWFFVDSLLPVGPCSRLRLRLAPLPRGCRLRLGQGVAPGPCEPLQGRHQPRSHHLQWQADPRKGRRPQ